jgi:arylsulfatase A-like enzyme
MRTGLAAWALVAAACAGCRAGSGPSPSPSATPDRRPNIVLVVVDTLARDHLPFYGYPKDTAPFLSELARQGVVFERAHSTSTWTAPATASIMTSMYPPQHGVTHGLMATRRLQRQSETVRLNRLPDEAETLAETLLTGGYATFAVAENVNISASLGFQQGFLRFRNLRKESGADALNRRLFNWTGQLRSTRPYFLYLHYLDPHEPYTPRAPWYDASQTGDARQASAYDSEISFVDRQLRLAWERLGWERDTLLVVTADHGESFGRRGFAGHGHTLFGEVLDVPLLVVFPDRRQAGRRVTERVNHLDLAPTLADFAGLPRRPQHEGRSLLPLLAGGAAPASRALFAHLHRRQPNGQELELHAVIDGDWKLIAGPGRAPQLYDLGSDPGERRDLAPAQPERVADLERRWSAFLSGARRVAAQAQELELDAEARERLRALGYVQ